VYFFLGELLPVCENCDSVIPAWAAFCPNCGAQAGEVKASKGPESEQILHRFGCTGTGTEFFELVFTPNRMIIAKTGGRPYLTLSQMLQAAAESQKKKAELQGLSPEGILADNPENIPIAYSDILSIEMKRPGLVGGGRMKIQMRETKKQHEFRLPEKREFQGHVDFLRSVLKERVIVK